MAGAQKRNSTGQVLCGRSVLRIAHQTRTANPKKKQNLVVRATTKTIGYGVDHVARDHEWNGTQHHDCCLGTLHKRKTWRDRDREAEGAKKTKEQKKRRPPFLATKEQKKKKGGGLRHLRFVSTVFTLRLPLIAGMFCALQSPMPIDGRLACRIVISFVALVWLFGFAVIQ